MIMNIVSILQETPIWVWVLLSYLFITGIQASRPSNVSIWRLSIMPTIFMVWSLYGLYKKCFWCLQPFVVWCGSLVGGLLIGYYLSRKHGIRVDGDTALIHMPGSFVPLILALMFFAVKYTLGVHCALNPLMKESTLLLTIDTLMTGLISGISAGRFAYIVRVYRSSMANK